MYYIHMYIHVQDYILYIYIYSALLLLYFRVCTDALGVHKFYQAVLAFSEIDQHVNQLLVPVPISILIHYYTSRY
jgi:hypothetical protein